MTPTARRLPVLLIAGLLLPGRAPVSAAEPPAPWVEEIRPADPADADLAGTLLAGDTDARDGTAWARAFARAQELAQDDPAAAAPLLAGLVQERPEVLAARGALAWALYGAERWDEAAAAFAACAELGVERIPNCHFNRACCLARGGRPDAALDALADALATGWESRHRFLADDDLASLRDDPRFATLAGSPPAADLDRVAGWRLDLAYLDEELTRLHWRLTHGGEAANTRVALDALAARVDELDDEQIAAGIQEILAGLGDGHTVLYPMPGNRVTPNRYLPLATHWFADGLFVVAADDTQFAPWIGAEVVAVGGVPAADLPARLAPYVSRDNPMGLLWMGPTFLRFTSVLRGAGLAGPDGAVEFELHQPGGATTSIVVPPIGDLGGAHGGLPAPSGAPTPLWLQRQDEPYWTVWLADDSVLYAQFSVIRNGNGYTVAGFADEIRSGIAEKSPRAVVLDLRRNSGGNSFLNRPLVAALVAWEVENPDGRLFVLSGRKTFSAAQNLLAEIDYWTDAVIVGEPSGSRPNFIGESSRVQLPWSGLMASVSSRYHQSSYPTDQRLWIGPDVPVRLTSQDHFGGHDPVLDAALALAAAQPDAAPGP